MSENRDLLSFKGSIGRKWFLLRILTAFLIPILPTMLVLVIGRFLTHSIPAELGTPKSPNIFGVIVALLSAIVSITLTIYFLLSVISLKLRRGRDIFRQNRPRPLIEFVMFVLFWITGGYFGIGAIALFIWPGELAYRKRNDQGSSVAT